MGATERLLAASTPYRKVKCMRFDNGGEFTFANFEAILRRNRLRHNTSAPYSPDQNYTGDPSLKWGDACSYRPV